MSINYEQLLKELNEVLDRHEARVYIEGYESSAWINHKDDHWAHEGIHLNALDGKLHDIKELY